jgi:hypothetical protein
VDPRAFLHLARGGDRNLAQACYDIQVALALAGMLFVTAFRCAVAASGKIGQGPAYGPSATATVIFKRGRPRGTP